MSVNIDKAQFFNTVLMANQLVYYSELIQAGYVFKVELYSLKCFSKGGKGWQLGLPVGASTLMKDNSSVEIVLGRKVVNEFILKVHEQHLKSISTDGNAEVSEKEKAELSKAVGQAILNKLAEQKAAANSANSAASAEPTPVKPKAKAKPVLGKIKLQQAKALGQQVYGTSPTSTYKTIAFNDRVKVAGRVEGESLSIRVEVDNPTNSELQAVKKVVIWNAAKDYGSVHFNYHDIPLRRILGAVLFDLNVKFDEIIPLGEDILL